jgi:hypothetical protein
MSGPLAPAVPPLLAASPSMTVIDDPSVPSLHALETFDQLAWVARGD